MPPIVAAGAITAAGAIAGGIIASKAQGRATKAQLKANEDAIAYQKEQQAARQSRYDAAYADYRKRYDDWLQQFYGVEPKGNGEGGVRASSGTGAGGIPPQAAAAGYVGGGTPGAQQASSIADLIAGQGRIQGDAALNSANLWGQTLNNAGQSLSSAILKNQKPKVPPVTGVVPPGVDPGLAASSQPAPLIEQKKPWTDWANYGVGF